MIKITNREIQKAFNNIIKQVQKPDYIVGVPRGGLWLAQYLAYYFDIDKTQMRFGLSQSEISSLSGRVLVCDDIFDTGKQHSLFTDCEFVTLFARQRGKEFPVNLKYGILIESDEYLWFPWDFGD